jgi:hypothetical protein
MKLKKDYSKDDLAVAVLVCAILIVLGFFIIKVISRLELL